MAFIRNCILVAVMVICMNNAKGQTVYYPANSSQQLKSTAADVAQLLQRSIPGSLFNTQSYITLPNSGIVLIYDSTIIDNQACRVVSGGSNVVYFSAAEDNGLCFGIYEYLQQSGFRFYQPGSIWEMIPVLTTPFKKTDTVFTSAYKYKTWFISGGHNRWAMDNTSTYNWDTYFGNNGHQWSLYQRRNGMTGAYRFSGHRGDVMTGGYMATLQANPCYVASHDSSRVAGNRSVPDIHNPAAVNFWANTIEQKHSQYINTIYSNSTLYVNQFRNMKYFTGYMGIEVPDGANWGNTKDNTGCSNTEYPTASDQQFTLANLTASRIELNHPGKRYQVYAYAAHADVPSPNLAINPKLDIQVIPAAYQQVSSTNGLRNRWYNRASNISEYHYLNIPQWSGETPSCFLDDLKGGLQIAKDKKSQGIVWEASPAKFASLPFLLAANRELKNNIPVEKTLEEFCTNMFAGAGNTIYRLLKAWSDEQSMIVGGFNRYKLPYYLRLLNEAVMQTQQAGELVKSRIYELKAYLHYMVLYFDLSTDQRSTEAKSAQAAALCLYLAKINKLQLVNSYYLILNIVSKYTVGSNFYAQYNVTNGSAYLGGNLPLITPEEIEANYQKDINERMNLVDGYVFESTGSIKNAFAQNQLKPLGKINLELEYTNGADFYNRSEFFIEAPGAGSFTVSYTPRFNQAGKGYVNFIVESAASALDIIKDLTLDNRSKAGTFTVQLPASGKYKLTILSKFKTSLALSISTNGNYFYKNGAFLGTKTEDYKKDPQSLPGYFHIPEGMRKIYFSIGNSNPGGNGFANPEKISKAFVIKDHEGRIQVPRVVTPKDSALFYLELPLAASGKFWQVTRMDQYNLCFVNISNLLWHAAPQPCAGASFTIAVVKQKGECITELKTLAPATALEWEITDLGKVYYFSKLSVLTLPDFISPQAVITLRNGSNCSFTRKLLDDKQYLSNIQQCAAAGARPAETGKTTVFPNPSTGTVNCIQNGKSAQASEVSIMNATGAIVARFKNVQQFDISTLAAGVYWYSLTIREASFKGKLMKL